VTLIFSPILLQRFRRAMSQLDRLEAEFASIREMRMALIPSPTPAIAAIRFESACIPAEGWRTSRQLRKQPHAAEGSRKSPMMSAAFSSKLKG
jgi:hypothetical protein